MLPSLFENSTLPVLEQVVSFTQARHGVLAGNIANLDTPGYRTRDLSTEAFQEQLQEALTHRERAAARPATAYDSPSYRAAIGRHEPTSRQGSTDFRGVRENLKSILYHDDSDVSLEKQVTEISKNHARHNLALTLMTHQFRLLQAAISERVA